MREIECQQKPDENPWKKFRLEHCRQRQRTQAGTPADGPDLSQNGYGRGGADVMHDTCLYRYAPAHATNWSDRTPGSQTPGVPATLGLNVHADGERKMPQNCSKLPLIAATTHSCSCAYQPLLRRGMSTNTGDELNLRHLHCRETTCRCMITLTSITKKEQ